MAATLNKEPLIFEITKRQLLKFVILSFIWSGAAALMLFLCLGVYIFSRIPTNIPQDVWDGCLRASLLGTACGIGVSILVYILLIAVALHRTAYKVCISDHELVINTYWRELRFSWTEIAKVKILNLVFRKCLYVQTRDRRIVLLVPPLGSMDKLAIELQSRVLS